MSEESKPSLDPSNRVKLELTFSQLDSFTNNCNALKTFFHMPFKNMLKLQKNFTEAQNNLTDANMEAQLINIRLNELRQEYTADQANQNLLKELTDITNTANAFNKKKYSVDVYTMPVSDFPNEDEFLKKVGENTAAIKAYLELIDLCIMEN